MPITPPLSQNRLHFDGLNVLRFVAALAVVVYHSTFGLQDRWPGAIKMTLHNLTAGVDLFFIISGFLIIYLLLAERQATNTINLNKFYLRRALRIFPLYFLIVAIAYYQYNDTNPEIDFHKYVYFWGNFWMIQRDAWTVAPLNPLWSLCIEEQFYFVIPLLVLWTPLKRIPHLFVGVIILSVGFRAYTSYAMQYNWMTLYCHTLSRCDLLALGGLIAYWHFTRPISLRLPDWLLGAVVFVFVVMLGVVDNSNFEGMNLATVKKYLYVAPLVFIFCFFVFNTSPLASALNNNRIIDYLGKISFGLYMYHSVIIDNLQRHNIQVPYYPLYLQPVLVIVLTIIVATISYELFEKQILLLKKRFEVIKTQKSLEKQPAVEQEKQLA